MVIVKNITNAGKSTKSRYPAMADKPSAPSRTTSKGVKQHSAVMIVPVMPVTNNLLFI